MPDLSILIPARNEMFLQRTIDSILDCIEADTKIIVVTDGYDPNPPLREDPRLLVIHHDQPIGQRAATNEAARVSTARYLMKLDAHCSVDKGFDCKLIEPYESGELGMDATTIPRMYNLHGFDWQCKACGNRTYQGPRPVKCEKCKTGSEFEMIMVWQPRWHRKTDFARFDHTLHFQYHSSYKERPEAQGDIADLMSSVGACFFMPRNRFIEIGGLDEQHGSWGQFGTEISCKSWLSGGRQVVNKRTFFCHMFRTQPGFGFPYSMSQSAVEVARAHSRKLWYENSWNKQIHPLSWLIEKFAPLPDWHEEAGRETLRMVNSAGSAFSASRENKLALLRSNPISSPDISSMLENGKTDQASSRLSSDLGGQQMAPRAMSLSGIDGGMPIAVPDVLGLGNKSEMDGIATGRIGANEMIQYGNISASTESGQRMNEPSIHQSMAKADMTGKPNVTVAESVSRPGPYPTTSGDVYFNLGKNSANSIDVQMGRSCETLAVSHSEPPLQAENRLESDRATTRSDSLIIPQNPTKGIVYYTDNRLDPVISKTVQRQIKRSVNGHQILSVSLEPMEFGLNRVLDLERGILTMFRQILLGLMDSSADIVFFCEHDVLYHPSHFDFVPPRKDVYYYNENTYKVRSSDGQALFYYTKQTSGLCAYRSLLLEHYRLRVARVEQEGHYDRRIGFEPGCHRYPRGIDRYKAERWMSKFPNIDIRHDANLTPSRFRQDQFRNPNSCLGWTMADEVPGWGRTKGRFNEFISELR